MLLGHTTTWFACFQDKRLHTPPLVLYRPSDEDEIDDDDGRSLDNAYNQITSLAPFTRFDGNFGKIDSAYTYNDEDEFAVFVNFKHRLEGLYLREQLDPVDPRLKIGDIRLHWTRPSVLFLHMHPRDDPYLKEASAGSHQWKGDARPKVNCSSMPALTNALSADRLQIPSFSAPSFPQKRGATFETPFADSNTDR